MRALALAALLAACASTPPGPTPDPVPGHDEADPSETAPTAPTTTWDAVVAAAAMPPVPEGPSADEAALAALTARWKPHAEALRALVAKRAEADPKDTTPIALKALPPEAKAILADTLAFIDRNPSFGLPHCDGDIAAVGLLELLTYTAPAVPKDQNDRQLSLALTLAARLIDGHPGLPTHLAVATVVNAITDLAKARGYPPSPALQAVLGPIGSLLRTHARELVCIDAIFAAKVPELRATFRAHHLRQWPTFVAADSPQRLFHALVQGTVTDANGGDAIKASSYVAPDAWIHLEATRQTVAAALVGHGVWPSTPGR